MTREDAKTLLLEQLEAIDGMVLRWCRRSHFSPQDTDDARSTVRLRLVEDDYARLRKYRGNSSFDTYLATVVRRLFQDYRNTHWGRYRPSAQAIRLGPDAIALETRLVRDGEALDEAIEQLVRNRMVCATRPELEALAAQLPARARRQFVADDILSQLVAPGTAMERVEDGERAEVLACISKVLGEALEELSVQDRLLLRMYYRDRVSMAIVARVLHERQRILYNRRDRCLRHLKKRLKAAGLGWKQVRQILGWHRGDLRIQLSGKGRHENGLARQRKPLETDMRGTHSDEGGEDQLGRRR